MSWKRDLVADPTEWLLEQGNPPIRHGTLIDILDRSVDDPEAAEARAAIPTYEPVAELLASQKPDGHWGSPDYYLPRTSLGTFWVLSALGDLGLTAENEHIRKGCEFMFGHQRESGVFCRRRRIKGQGLVWQEHGEPCTHSRIVRFLIQFGYGDDPRVRKAIDWLRPIQREDGMWSCREGGRRGCIRATLDVLRVAALDPQTAAWPGIAQAASVASELVLEPRMSRYLVGEFWGTWERFKYPHYGFGLISALDALASLGCTLEQPKIAAGMEYLLSRQLPDGAWPLDESWSNPPIDFGEVGQPNEWLTLDALRVVKLLFGEG